MHRSTRILALAGLLFVASCSDKGKAKPANGQAAPGESATQSESPKLAERAFPSEAELLALIKARVDEKRAVGVVLAVRESDGTHTIVSYGSAGQGAKPLSGKSVFEIGSISKVFTGTLLADMQARGLVKEEDPAQKYAHEGVKIPTKGESPIRLVDLATHMSSLPRMPANLTPKDPNNPYADYTVEQLHSFVGGLTLEREVGSKHEYSNLGTGLLGHLLAAVNKSDWETLVKERILSPLDMGMSGVTLSAEMQAQLVRGHDQSGDPVHNWDIPTLAGAGALRSSAEDMLKFLDACLTADASPLSLAMQSSHRPRVDTGERTKIGLNWMTMLTDEHELVWHNGGTGGYHSFIAFDAKRSVGVVILLNSAHSMDDLGLHLLDSSLPLAAAPKKHVEIEIKAELLATYVGVYELTPDFLLEVSLEGGNLFTQATGQAKVQIFAESEVDFFLKVVDAQLTFVSDESGTVTGLVLHQGGLDQPAKKTK